MFAQMLQEANLKKISRIPDRRQLIGHYFQTAAVYVQKWKRQSIELTPNLYNMLRLKTTENLVIPPPSYIGQVPDCSKKGLMKVAIIIEKSIEHSEISLDLFLKSQAAFQ
eukprot:UN32002